MDDTILIITLVVAVIGFAVGWHMRAIMLIKGMSDNPEHFIQLLEQVKKINDEYNRDLERLNNGENISEVGTELSIEKVNGVFYAYTKDTNQFIAQGSSVQALFEQAQQRHPNRKFFGAIAKEDSAKELV